MEKNRFVNKERDQRLAAIKTTVKAIGLTGLLLVGGAALHKGYEIYSANEVRKAYFSELPIERVVASDNTLLGMRNRVTEGLPRTTAPTVHEFIEHVVENNPDVSAYDLNYGFGGRVTSLNLPNYDGKSNN